jgi:hypothetical protein
VPQAALIQAVRQAQSVARRSQGRRRRISACDSARLPGARSLKT